MYCNKLVSSYEDTHPKDYIFDSRITATLTLFLSINTHNSGSLFPIPLALSCRMLKLLTTGMCSCYTTTGILLYHWKVTHNVILEDALPAPPEALDLWTTSKNYCKVKNSNY